MVGDELGDVPAWLQMRDGIHTTVARWARDTGHAVRRTGPWGVAAFLLAGAVTPVLLPLATAAGGSAVAGAIVGALGNIGTDYLSGVLTKAVERAQDRSSPEALRETVATELLARLESDGEGSAGLRAEIAEVLRAAGGVDTALSAAMESGSSDLQRTLSAAFSDLGSSFAEFRWMLDDMRTMVADIHEQVGRTREQVATQGVEQRRQTDLLRRMFVTLMALSEAPPDDSGGPGAQLTQAGHVTTGGPCPYQGLAAFEPEDAERFFGRDGLTATMLTALTGRLGGTGILFVTGPSGAGKSSLVRAGLLPALARGLLPVVGSASWPWLLFTPGEHPVAELAERTASLAGVYAGGVADDLLSEPGHYPVVVRQALRAEPGPRPGKRLILVIDQFEELFTHCRTERERQAFIGALYAAATGGEDGQAVALVVIGIRADFYGRCAAYPELVPLLQDGQIVVGPMSTPDLRRAIEAPARLAGLTLEPGLSEVVLGDLGAGSEAAGALPLLSHALAATWRQRRGSVLTLEAYQAGGGIRGAVATTAEAIYDDLDETGRRELRRLLRRLVTVGDGAEDTRRRVRRGELLPGEADGVLAKLVEARLVTVHEDSVEITHEALLRAWPRLRGWLGEDRAGLRVHRRLTFDAQNWHDLGREPDALYRGGRLAAAREWAADPDHDADLNPLERDFLYAGIKARDHEDRAARLRTRLLRAVAGTLAVLLLAALTAGGIAFQQRRKAVAAGRAAAARQLVAQADTLGAADPRTALRLGLAADTIDPGPQTRSGLLTTLTQTRYAGALTGHLDGVFALAFGPDRRTLATVGYDNRVSLWDVTRSDRPRQLGTLDGAVSWAVAFSPDGRTLATADKGGTATLWNVADRTRTATVPGHGGSLYGIAFGPDGRTLAAGSNDGAVALWNVADRAHPKRLAALSHRTDGLSELVFSPDGRMLGVTGADGRAVLWNTSRPARPKRLATLGGHAGDYIEWIAFAPHGHTLATAEEDRTAKLWDLSHPARPRRVATLSGHTAIVTTVAFSPDGRTLASGGDDGTALLWNVAATARPERIAALPAGGRSGVSAVAFSSDGRALITAGADHNALVWEVAGRVPRRAATLSPGVDTAGAGATRGVAFGSRGTVLATAYGNGTGFVWSVADRDRPRRLAHLTPAGLRLVAFSPDGRTLATTGGDGVTALWNATDPAHLARLAALPHGSTAALDTVFSPDGRTLAVQNPDGTTTLWNVTAPAHPQRRTTFTGNKATGLNHVAFSRDGRTVATTGGATAMLWDVSGAGPRNLATLRGFEDHAADVAFSPDRRTLVVTGDHTAMLWDVRDRARPRHLATLNGHAGGVTNAVFSPDGAILATDGNDGTAILWDVTDRTSPVRLATLQLGGQSGDGIAFGPDGRTVATISERSARLWDIGDLADTVSRPAALACAIAGSGLTRREWASYLPGVGYQDSCH